MSPGAATARAEASLELVRPRLGHLPAYRSALERGWSPDSVRGAAAVEEQLAQLDSDPLAFLELMDDPDGRGPPVTLPDGTQRARIPSLRRWMWLGDAAAADGFVGTIGLRWPRPGEALPPQVLGHIGYAVVPWHQRRGHATRALALMLEIARQLGLAEVEITTDPDNVASRRVIEANGASLAGPFDKGAAYGHRQGLRYRIPLAP